MEIDKLIPVAEVPDYLPIKLGTLRSYIHLGKIPVSRIGRRVYLNKSTIIKISQGGLNAFDPKITLNIRILMAEKEKEKLTDKLYNEAIKSTSFFKDRDH